MFESLEPRRLFASAIVGNTLVIQGTGGSDIINVVSTKGFYVVSFNGKITRAVLRSKIKEIEVFGGNGGDKISCRSVSCPCLIVGGDGRDTIFGGGGNDTLIGGTGNDQITSNNGSDVAVGNDQNDSISGGGGDDFIWGGTGNDRIDGGKGNNVVFEPTADEKIKNAVGTDTLPPSPVFVPDAVTPMPQVGYYQQGGKLIAELRWTLPAGSQVIPGRISQHHATYYLDVITDTATTGGPLVNFDFAFTIDSTKAIFHHSKPSEFRLEIPQQTGTNAQNRPVGFYALAPNGLTKMGLPGPLPNFSAVPIGQPKFG